MNQINPNLSYLRNNYLDKRVIVLQGGTRSGKTYSTLQFLIELCYEYQGSDMVVTVARETLASLRGTAMKDFVEILNGYDYYSEHLHNKKHETYKMYGNEFQFMGVKDSQKIRGSKRDVLYVNEANELSYESFRQLALRTQGFIILDYNPSMDHHWIYDHVLTRNDASILITTYRDNPHLSKDLVNEIEQLELTDPNYWKIYGLGHRGVPLESIYVHWKQYSKLPEGCDKVYGLDFGFNHPSALVEINIKENFVFWKQLIYESYLTNSQIIQRMKDLDVDKKAQIFCDAAEPARIQEISEAGFNVFSADKSVKDGIDKVKTCHLFIHEESVDLLKEIKNYKWKSDRNGHIFDEPVKFLDDGMDAGRYGTYNYLLKPKKIKPARITIVGST